jgi:hypothetical protein
MRTCSDDPLITLVNAKSDSATGALEFAGLNQVEFWSDNALRVLYTVDPPVEHDVEDPPK